MKAFHHAGQRAHDPQFFLSSGAPRPCPEKPARIDALLSGLDRLAIRPEEIATSLRENVEFDSVLSNSFGFGGTNATLVMSKYRD